MKKNNLQKENHGLISKFFWAITAAIILFSIILYGLSYIPTNNTYKDILKNLSMITLGAIMATLIHEYVLGVYYKLQSRKIILDSLSPNFKEVKDSVDSAVEQIVKEVATQTVDSINDIQSRVAEASDFMINGIDVLQGAKYSGIVNIFPTRYEDCGSKDDIKNIIVNDIRSESNLIRLMGISLGDYFLDRGILHSSLIELLETWKDKEDSTKIQALLVHPKCNSLKERARWEAGEDYYKEPAFFDSTTFIETDGAARIAKRLCQKYPTSLEVRLYSQAPTAFILLTSRFAFYEPYNYAARGSNVPLTQVQAGVSLYKHYSSHFDRVWDVSEPIQRFDSIRGNGSNS